MAVAMAHRRSSGDLNCQIFSIFFICLQNIFSSCGPEIELGMRWKWFLSPACFFCLRRRRSGAEEKTVNKIEGEDVGVGSKWPAKCQSENEKELVLVATVYKYRRSPTRGRSDVAEYKPMRYTESRF